MQEFGFRLHPGFVRGDLFSETGKWKYTVEIDMRDYYVGLINHMVLDAFYNNSEGVSNPLSFKDSGYKLVVLEPYHERSHPVMLIL